MPDLLFGPTNTNKDTWRMFVCSSFCQANENCKIVGQALPDKNKPDKNK